jgi:hypothetical protein
MFPPSDNFQLFSFFTATTPSPAAVWKNNPPTSYSHEGETSPSSPSSCAELKKIIEDLAGIGDHESDATTCCNESEEDDDDDDEEYPCADDFPSQSTMHCLLVTKENIEAGRRQRLMKKVKTFQGILNSFYDDDDDDESSDEEEDEEDEKDTSSFNF